jgi:hypothetical protein
MRALIRNAIATDPTLMGLGVALSNVLSGDVDTPQGRPFINLRWGTTSEGLAHVTRRNLTIWVHDRPGDYDAKIDPIIRRLRVILPGLEGVAHPYGSVEWAGDSEDLVDDGHGTIARTTSYSLVGSGQ